MFIIGICEDNKEFSIELKAKIKEKFFQYNLHCEIYCFYSGEEILNSNIEFDIIFFDIKLPGINGIETARKIRELDNSIIFIFITYLDEKVYEVLDLQIFNFIRKSHFHEEIDRTLDSLIKRLGYLAEKYPFPIGDIKIYLKLYDIIYLEILNRRVVIHTRTTNYTSKYRSLKEIPYNLKEKQFFEIYRGIMVNLNHVKDFIDNKINLSNGDALYISRRRLTSFKETFFRYISSKRDE